jgi:TonB family protein
VELRGLSENRPIVFRVLEDDTFDRLAAANLARKSRGRFHGVIVHASTPDLAGFYDEFSKTIFLRHRLSDAEFDDLLAHEAEHALQDQNFGIPEFASMWGSDRFFAIKALLEGDAHLVEIAYKQTRLHGTWSYPPDDPPALEAVRYAYSKPFSSAASSSAADTAWREANAFVYGAGTAFVAALYHAGGFALVDKALARPPESTAQILEPERYLATRQPAKFGRLPLAEDSQIVDRATLGPLRISLLLARFPSAVPIVQRLPAMIGWNGDEFVEFKRPGTASEFFLTTEWTSAEAASRFEALARRSMTTKGPPIADTPEDTWATACEGTSVAIVHGRGARSTAPTLLHLGMLVGDRRPAHEEDLDGGLSDALANDSSASQASSGAHRGAACGQVKAELGLRSINQDAGVPAASSGDAAVVDASAPKRQVPWPTGDAARWRGALFGYVDSVTPDRAVMPIPIKTVAVPFAAYLNAMHERIHPVFSDWFLHWLDTLPSTDSKNAPDLHTRAEIVVDKSGRVVRMGISRTSGESEFDRGVLESIDRAQPFAQPPTAILSADGNVYVHWIFYRDETCACSTMGSRPFVLR